MRLRKIADITALVGIGICIGGIVGEVSSASHALKDWQTMIAGIFAVFAAMATVFEIRRQIAQAEAHRNEDWRRKTSGIATVVNIDLWDTSDRLRDAERVGDLTCHPISKTSWRLIKDVALFAPVLAAAIQKHYTELHVFISIAEKSDLVPEYFDEEKLALAYRAYVLSRCFSYASFRLLDFGVVGRNYMTRGELVHLREVYNADERDDGFLEHVFRETGLG
jgi:hypothetical protein